jgi:hypothetical protein
MRMLLAVLAITSVGGCSAALLTVNSTPPGARVLIDGRDTGKETPALFLNDEIERGEHEIRVEGHGVSRQSKSFDVRLRKGRLVASILIPPLLLLNIPRGFRVSEPNVLNFDEVATLNDAGSVVGARDASPQDSRLPDIDERASETVPSRGPVVRTVTPRPRATPDYNEPISESPQTRAPVVRGTTPYEPASSAHTRRKLKNVGTRCAALPLKQNALSQGMASVVDELLLAELMSSGFDPIGRDDLNALLDFEKQRDVSDCSEASCIAEIGNALGVPYLVSGNVVRLEGSCVLTLKLLDVRRTRVVARVSRVRQGGEEILPGLLLDGVEELVAQSKM